MRATYLICAAVLCLTIGMAASAAASPRDLQNVRVTVKEIEPFSYCAVPHKGSFGDMSGILNDLIAIMQSQSIPPSGDLIAIYNISPQQEIPDSIEYEVGFPITPQVLPQPPLQKKEWNHQQVAFAEHRGPYAETADTIDKIFDWIEANQYQQDGPILGRFTVIPTQEVLPSDLRTEIWIPIKKQ
jgi:effector-binding domain-containing protein